MQVSAPLFVCGRAPELMKPGLHQAAAVPPGRWGARALAGAHQPWYPREVLTPRRSRCRGDVCA